MALTRSAILWGIWSLIAVKAYAAGPSEVALADQSLWPNAIVDRPSFDSASRAEILAMLSVLTAVKSSTAEALGVKRVNQASVDRWWDWFLAYWQKAFALASSSSCKGSEPSWGCEVKNPKVEELLALASSLPQKLPPQFQPWWRMSQGFYTAYLKEQLRLAALFPNPTSEILPLRPSEVLGDAFEDGHFLLTFDDGPTPVGGDTEKYAELLQAAGIKAYFFVLGQSLQNRLQRSSVEQLKNLYENHCLASHGYEHKSHQRWQDWRSSLGKTRSLIHQIAPGSPVPFRPPYGQRHEELVVAQDQEARAPVMLWNIDSQDWHAKMTSRTLGDRVQKLMLLWRKGIVLFHDVHPKAKASLPHLIAFANKAELSWVACDQKRP